eukprot:scaffold16504_cov72-Phaeocystis_antarctica.AAC.1
MSSTMMVPASARGAEGDSAKLARARIVFCLRLEKRTQDAHATRSPMLPQLYNRNYPCSSNE